MFSHSLCYKSEPPKNICDQVSCELAADLLVYPCPSHSKPWYEVLLGLGEKKEKFCLLPVFFCPIKSVSAGQMCKEDDGVNGVFIICAYMYTQTHHPHHHHHHHHHRHNHNYRDDKQTSTRKRPLTLGYFSFLKCLKLDANEGFVCRGNLHKCTDNHPSSSAKTLGASQGPIMGFAFAEGTSV